MSDPTSNTTTWQPIKTAPQDFVMDFANEHPDLPYQRMRMGREIVIQGTCDGETEEFRAVWTVLDEQEGYWMGEDEPVDWPITEWRELTEAECSEHD